MNNFKFWFNNARPISLPQSLLPALTAVALSVGGNEFNWIAAIVSVIGVIFLHLSLNLMDDWFDYKEGSAEAKATVRSALDRMKEFPDFKFVCSSASVYRWIEEFDEEMFEEIKSGQLMQGREELISEYIEYYSQK